MSTTEMRWEFDDACPANWRAHLGRCGGGFFHTPPGVRAGAPAGTPLYARLMQGEEVTGVALGVVSRCRLGPRNTHVYFPSLPAIPRAELRAEALDRLAQDLRERHVVESTLDSFDASWHPGATLGGTGVPSREEHVLQLDGLDPTALTGRCSENHRRVIRRGERAGLRLRTHGGAEAVALLERVRQVGQDRAHRRGDGFESQIPVRAIEGYTADLSMPWGVSTFAAWNDAGPIAAALVGWGEHRAYYVMGASTPEGYHAGASFWLHWKVMSRLAEAGCLVYNIGGTPAAAADPEHPQFGLRRFKAGFGGEIVPCQGGRWTFVTGHLRLHRFAQWVAERVA